MSGIDLLSICPDPLLLEIFREVFRHDSKISFQQSLKPSRTSKKIYNLYQQIFKKEVLQFISRFAEVLDNPENAMGQCIYITKCIDSQSLLLKKTQDLIKNLCSEDFDQKIVDLKDMLRVANPKFPLLYLCNDLDSFFSQEWIESQREIGEKNLLTLFRVLLEAGADPNALGVPSTPLLTLLNQSPKQKKDVDLSKDVLKLLLSHGADLDFIPSKDFYGYNQSPRQTIETKYPALKEVIKDTKEALPVTPSPSSPPLIVKIYHYAKTRFNNG